MNVFRIGHGFNSLPHHLMRRKQFHTGNGNIRYAVAKVVDESWRPVKEKFLKMSLEDKRSQYYCKGTYLDLPRIRPWPIYFDHMKIPPTKNKRKYAVNFPLNNKVSIGRASLIGLELDAVVNSTSNDMMGTGGELDQLVHLAAGEELKLECMTFKGCDVGESKISGGYRLPAKYIIHTVGPKKKNDIALTACYKSCLKLMRINNLRTIAFPCISTKSSQFPAEDAAHIALEVTREFLQKYDEQVERICFPIQRDEDLAAYWDLMQIYFPLKM